VGHVTPPFSSLSDLQCHPTLQGWSMDMRPFIVKVGQRQW
jgi:hypothetical protein